MWVLFKLLGKHRVHAAPRGADYFIRGSSRREFHGEISRSFARKSIDTERRSVIRYFAGEVPIW